MGMNTFVVGIVPPDENHLAMLAAYEACQKAGVSLPEEVEEYFDDEGPDPAGMFMDIGDDPEVVREWNDGDMREGFEVVLSELPPQVKVIRFYNSY